MPIPRIAGERVCLIWEVWKNPSEVDSFFLNDQRLVLDLSVNGADVFSDDADEKELNSSEEEHADHQRRKSEVEGIPPDELDDQIDERNQNTEKADYKA